MLNFFKVLTIVAVVGATVSLVKAVNIIGDITPTAKETTQVVYGHRVGPDGKLILITTR